MHVGHCRGAVFGDALANLLIAAGYEVTREYYINDAGAQIEALTQTGFLRYREALGQDIGPIPEGLYPGDYVKQVGEELKADYGDELLRKPESEWKPIVRERAINIMMADIRNDLWSLGVVPDVFFSEASLTEEGDQVAATIEFLRQQGYVFEGRLPPPKGAPVDDYEDREQTLFRATAFGDDVDRPLKKSDGSYTYFASDIAYHKNKIDRGFKPDDRRLGRRSRRLRQAHAGGGEGLERQPSRPISTSRSSSSSSSCATASRSRCRSGRASS